MKGTYKILSGISYETKSSLTIYNVKCKLGTTVEWLPLVSYYNPNLKLKVRLVPNEINIVSFISIQNDFISPVQYIKFFPINLIKFVSTKKKIRVTKIKNGKIKSQRICTKIALTGNFLLNLAIFGINNTPLLGNISIDFDEDNNSKIELTGTLEIIDKIPKLENKSLNFASGSGKKIVIKLKVFPNDLDNLLIPMDSLPKDFGSIYNEVFDDNIKYEEEINQKMNGIPKKKTSSNVESGINKKREYTPTSYKKFEYNDNSDNNQESLLDKLDNFFSSIKKGLDNFEDNFR